MTTILPRMLRRLVKRLALVLCASAVLAPCAHAQGVRALTYNIRLDTAADGPNAWPHRRQAMASLISFYAPDVMGMQEVLAHQRQQLAEDLPDYVFVSFGRDDGAEAGESSPLAFRRVRFSLSESGVFWLSPTPESPSMGWDAAYRRIVTWARLTERGSGAHVLALSTHWDHVGRSARAHSGDMVRRWIAQNRRPCETVILLGDLNAHPDEASYRNLTSARGPLRDTIALSATPPFGPVGTFNGFDIARAEPGPIDYILVSDGVDVTRHGVITQHEGGRLPSDHSPVLADLSLPKQSCGAAR